MTMDEAREAFYAAPNKVTAADYLAETLQFFTDRFKNDEEDDFYLYRAAGEVAFWLKFDRVERMPYSRHPR